MRNVTGVTLIIVFALVTGCGPASGTPDDGRSGSPAARPGGPGTASPAGTTPAGTAPRLVLRGWISGGIAGRGGPGAFPDFSLYDDATAIAPKGGFGGPVRPMEYRLTPGALHRLLGDARAAGLARSRNVDRSGVSDATYLTLRFGTGGRTATTRIIQVGTENDPAERFWDRLHAQGAAGGIGFAPSELAADPAPYRPARLAVLATDLGPGTGETPRDWPLAPLSRGERAGGWLCTVLTGDRQARAAKLLAADPDVRWRSEGRIYGVLARPLLPDESGCRALGTR